MPRNELTPESRKELSRRLLAAKKRSGVKNLTKAANLYGVDPATAFRALHGVSSPSAETIVAMADMFNTTPGKLLDGLEVK